MTRSALLRLFAAPPRRRPRLRTPPPTAAMRSSKRPKVRVLEVEACYERKQE
ncbi:MAG: hypothetical protein ACJ754_02520 [Pyrinomonadaceae bacterium]